MAIHHNGFKSPDMATTPKSSSVMPAPPPLSPSIVTDMKHNVPDPHVSWPLKKSTYLDRLPEELIEHIFGFFVGDRASIGAMMCTKRRNKRIGEAHMYTGVYTEDNFIIDNIASNPKYAKHVKMIGLSRPWRFEFGKQQLIHGQLVKLLDIIQAAVNVQKLLMYDMPSANFLNGYSEPRASLSLIPGELGSTSNRSAHFTNIHLDTIGTSLDKLQQIFYLPALEDLSMSGVHQHGPLRNWTVPESSCHVKHMRLIARCRMNSEAAQTLIMTAKALRTFTWGISVSTLRSSLSFTILGVAIRAQGHSLEEFAVSLRYGGLGNGHSLFGTLGDLRTCTQLLHIRVPMFTILDREDDFALFSDRLPSTLQWLCLTTGSNDNLPRCFPAAIESLKDVLIPGPKSLFGFDVPPGTPLQRLRLYLPLKCLEDGDITIDVRFGGQEYGLEDQGLHSEDATSDDDEDDILFFGS